MMNNNIILNVSRIANVFSIIIAFCILVEDLSTLHFERIDIFFLVVVISNLVVSMNIANKLTNLEDKIGKYIFAMEKFIDNPAKLKKVLERIKIDYYNTLEKNKD